MTPGAYRRMFARNVAAIWGYPTGPKKVQGSRPGDILFAYVNNQGICAIGRVLTGEVISGEEIFIDERGRQCPNEYHLEVEWEVVLPEAEALTAAEAKKLGCALPVRWTFGQLSNVTGAGVLESEIRQRD